MLEYPKYELKECPRCGRLFSCTGEMGCWCLSVSLSVDVSDFISSRYEGCLCKQCLRNIEEELREKRKQE